MNEEEERPEEERKIIPAELVEKLISSDELLERVEAYLRGEILERQPDGTYKRKKIGKALLNEKGIQEILQIMRKRLNEIYPTSILSMDFIAQETYFFNLNLAELVADKCASWDLDPAHYQELIDFLVSTFEATLRKALLGRLLGYVAGVIPYEEQKKKPRLLPFI